MVDFALRQVARQRHAGGEVVLAAHGFEVDTSMTRALDGVHQWQLQVLSVDRAVPFGAVLNRAAERASGDVLLKMDDDDWYGPEFVSDLLLARGYSGADIVGMLAEFSFLEPLWLTVRRPDLTECYSTFVAGGTIMIDRTTFADVGGFRPLRHFVDAGLLAAVREGGGSIYRTQGLGYLLRRGKSGHTWDPGMGYFIAAARVSAQWHGFRPSGELAVEPRDCPQRATDDRYLMAGERS
jgi:glycosyltransferase involved in cell wall biosynthesis